jgi:hypothetical protein
MFCLKGVVFSGVDTTHSSLIVKNTDVENLVFMLLLYYVVKCCETCMYSIGQNGEE